MESWRRVCEVRECRRGESASIVCSDRVSSKVVSEKCARVIARATLFTEIG
jgi:hypothetical protein